MGAKSSRQSVEPLRIQIGVQNSTQKKQNRVKTTKYTLLTFLPLNFYDQFRRAVYFYFLLVTIISFFVNSTISPMVSLIPLLFVMVVTALKEGREDYLRSRSDKLVNELQATVLREGRQVSIASEDIAVGDLVFVSTDTDVPCDLVLLKSSDRFGKCYITTANLDGETNLKTLMVPAQLPGNLNELTAYIECEQAQADLYSFQGKIDLCIGSEELRSQTLPMTSENLLLRGACVKNTEWVIGCAVYTGMNTKLQLNSRYTGNKSASSEIYINKFLIFLVVGMVLAVTILYLIARHEELHTVPGMFYLGPPINVNSFKQIMEDYLSFIVLFNYMVPISMYMNIEVYRVFGAYFMESDLQLYDEETDQRCVVNASNLNEDLGQLQILFSDKTGTLTKNEMKFQECSIEGTQYRYVNEQLVEVKDEDELRETLDLLQLTPKQLDFLKVLTVCHTVQVTHSEDTPSTVQGIFNIPNYQSSSADEQAFLVACANIGFIYLGDDGDIMRLQTGPKTTYELERLHTLQFSSERKRMSVIVRDEQERLWIYCKGAESTILPLCKESCQELVNITAQHINEYARLGLRTLAIASRQISHDEYKIFKGQLGFANSALQNRQHLIEKCYESVEKDLELLGATAVEDALQDNVAETLVALQAAGIRVWVLTGDKVETALNIGLACQHIPKNATTYQITECSSSDQLKEHFANLWRYLLRADARSYALIIDGKSLALALTELPDVFRDLALQCVAVLCCRLSPLQKCEVVQLLKRAKPKLITGAIGDGANDVSMIQEAHVGIGIMGKEGRQAARCADYAIGKFSMLQRLLLVHGHYNTARLSFLVLFYSYKNIIHTACMLLFQLYNIYSSAAVFHGLYMWLFDIVYLSYSFTFVALSEKPYSEEDLMSDPSLYRLNERNKQVSWWIFIKWLLNGAYHGLIIFYFAYFLFADTNVILSHGQTADYYAFGSVLIQLVITVGNLKLLLLCNYLSHRLVWMIFFSVVGFVVTTIIYNVLKLHGTNSLYWVYNYLLISPTMWLYTLLTIVACLIPDYTIKVIYTWKHRRRLQNDHF